MVGSPVDVSDRPLLVRRQLGCRRRIQRQRIDHCRCKHRGRSGSVADCLLEQFS